MVPTRCKTAEHSPPAEAIHVPFRGDYKRHEMVGLNVFVESLFDQFHPILGVDKFDPMTYAGPPSPPSGGYLGPAAVETLIGPR